MEPANYFGGAPMGGFGDEGTSFVVHPDRDYFDKGFSANRTISMAKGVIVEFFSNQETKMCAKSWALVPIMNLIPEDVQAFIYLLGLLYSFLGIAVISDVFMAAIEVITSKEKEVTLKGGQKVLVKVWNPTIANLSLMALGSSAPEIILALFETVQALGEPPGELGPSTIVGSAAFNLLVITAVCVYSIPSPRVKKISSPGVFILTSSWAVFAYIWLLIVLEVWTPGVVTIEEAFLTFGGFFIFIALAYAQDKNWFRQKFGEEAEESTAGDKILTIEEGDMKADDRKDVKSWKSTLKQMKMGKLTKSAVRSISKVLRVGLVTAIKDEDRSAMFWKNNAKRRLMGKAYMKRTSQMGDPLLEQQRKDMEYEEKTGIMQFTSGEFRVVENEGTVEIAVKRVGAHTRTIAVDFETRDGSGMAGREYTHSEGTLLFQPDDNLKIIEVQIIDDDEPEPDHTFSVVLSNPRFLNSLDVDIQKIDDAMVAKLGELAICIVTIIDDDDPGALSFAEQVFTVSERASSISLKVVRTSGAKGEISCKYHTSNGSAMSGEDYMETTGKIVFENGQSVGNIDIPLLESDKTYDRVFHVTLTEPSEHGRIEHRGNIALVRIVDDGSASDFTNRVEKKLEGQLKALTMSGTWADQFKSAIVPAKGVNEQGDEVDFEFADYLLHFLTIFWKVTAAFVPPPEYMGGWLAFTCALLYIGALTAVVGEIASLFGCALGLKDSVTAITFVALGTSLPDTFASRTSALEAPDADAAVGNVAGSNTVNVLLGLGLPWCIASVYYSVNDEKTDGRYCVPGGNLSYSVTIFTITALLCLFTLFLQRKMHGGELGGPKVPKTLVSIFLGFLWFMYIILSALNSYDYITFGSEKKIDRMGCPL